ncbi:cannabinoid receptor 2-like [Hoplias malabaricus]|uniref:cannabinoid receptor 2-like n=1 Tax=Hoplias malabaricus TaxID=27720 RepID=UPI003462E7D9
MATEQNFSETTDGSSSVNLSGYMVLTDMEKEIISWLCFLTGPITFLENILVLLVIGSSVRLRKRPTYLFIGSLALGDILASSFFPIIFLEFHIYKKNDTPKIYLFKLGGVTMAFTVSVGSLLLTSMDRYLCIYQAPRYKLVLTRCRALFGIMTLWVLAAGISFLPLMGWRCYSKTPCSQLFPYVDRSFMGCWAGIMLLVLLLIVVAYALILWKAHKHEAAMVVSKAGHSTIARQARMRMDIRLARTLGIILLILVLCWLPSLSIMLVDVSRFLSKEEQRTFAFCGMLCLVNSAINPILYALRCRELRRALINLLRCVGRVCTLNKCVSIQQRENNVGHIDNKDRDTVTTESLDRQHLD